MQLGEELVDRGERLSRMFDIAPTDIDVLCGLRDI